MTAYIAGNGISRQPICLHTVKNKGNLYGCNSIHTEITPDVLVAADSDHAHLIQMTGYGHDNIFYTRNPYSDKGAFKLKQPYANWSSGSNAVQLAILHGHTNLYLFGFDFGSTGDKFNNVFADTPYYKKSTDPATYGGNWHHQINTIIKHNKGIHFTIVTGSDTNAVDNIKNYKNVEIMSTDEFLKHINNV